MRNYFQSRKIETRVHRYYVWPNVLRSTFNVDFLVLQGTFQFVILFNGWNVLCHCFDSVIHIYFFFLSRKIFPNLPAPRTIYVRKTFMWVPQIQRKLFFSKLFFFYLFLLSKLKNKWKKIWALKKSSMRLLDFNFYLWILLCNK